jgi:O-antigen ligase
MYFLETYGSEEDYEKALKSMRYRESMGGLTLGYIPAHSHIASFFLWFGIVGLLYWLYVLYAIFRYFHKEMASAPHWFGILALGAPGFLWALFFSGFGFRIVTMPYVVLLFMAHSYYIGAKRLPIEIEMKIRLAEKK